MVNWRTIVLSVVGVLVASTAFAMKMEDQIEGIFRPDEEEIAALTKDSGVLPSAADIAAEAESANNRDLFFLAGKVYEFLADKPDFQKACEYYRRAAERGQPEATVRMAWLLVTQNDDAKSHEDALRRISEYVKKGNATAQVSEACMLGLGFGGMKRVAEGHDRLRQLAEQGVASAEYLMGTLYLEGIVIPQDTAKAFELLSRASQKGLPGAQLNLGICYNYGLGVAPSPELAFGWYLKAAEAGDTNAEHNIGNAYLRGRGVSSNFQKAQFWLRKSASRGRTESMTALGMAMLEDPNATPDTTREAVALLQQASSLGSAMGKYRLSLIYLDGRNLPFDFPKAVYLLRSAAEGGLPVAQFDLAKLLEFGSLDGVRPDKIEATKWCLLSSAQGYPPATPLLQELTSTMSEQDVTEAKARAAAFKPPQSEKSSEGKIQYRY